MNVRRYVELTVCMGWFALSLALASILQGCSEPVEAPASSSQFLSQSVSQSSVLSFGSSYTQTDAHMRSGPGKENQSLAIVPKGILVTLLSDPNDGQPPWVKVKAPGGETGFIHRSLLGANPPPETVVPVNGSLVGSWRGSVVNDGKSEDWIYTFKDDGTLESQTVDNPGQVFTGATGTYAIGDGRANISWPRGMEEKASIVWVNADEFEYAITSHTDEKQVGLKVVFHRSSPVSGGSEALDSGSSPELSVAEQETLQQQQYDMLQNQQSQQEQQRLQEQAANEDHYRREERGGL